MGVKSPILLHICCAPDTTHSIEVLSRNFEVSGYFYNPNIEPPNEYLRRLKETEKIAEILCVPLHKGDYCPELWYKETEGLEKEPEGGKRCIVCYRMRLEATAKFAKHMGFQWFTTTLTISPHKNSRIIFDIGKELGLKYGVDFLDIDFKKANGFRKSVERSRRLRLYRQDYCGCIYSLRDRIEVKRRKLVELHQEISNCRRCDFLRGQKVLPSGEAESRVMVVGQAPGKRELITSEPFSGPAGARLFKWLARIGFKEEDFRRIAYITATVKCYPGQVPGRKIDRSPSVAEIKNCRSFLEREIKILRPRIIIPIGRLAVNELIGHRRLEEVVGKKLIQEVFGHLCTIVPLPHPSGANPWTFRNSELLDRALWLLKEEILNG